MTPDTCCDTQHLTCATWHMTNFRSLALTVWELSCFEDMEEKDDWVTQLLTEVLVVRGSNSALLNTFMIFRCFICSWVYRTDIWQLKYIFFKLIDTGSNEESGCDYYNEKNLNSFQCSVTENKTKNIIITFFTNYHFWWVFLIISESVPFKELMFFGIVISVFRFKHPCTVISIFGL